MTKQKPPAKEPAVNPVGAPEGSKNAERFKTDEQKIKLFQDGLEHLRQGYDQNNFIPCDWETFTRYCNLYPEIFDEFELGAARREGKLLWEQRMAEHTTGKTKGGSDSCYIFTMKNKNGWRDKLQISGDRDNPLMVADGASAAEAAAAHEAALRGS